MALSSANADHLTLNATNGQMVREGRELVVRFVIKESLMTDGEIKRRSGDIPPSDSFVRFVDCERGGRFSWIRECMSSARHSLWCTGNPRCLPAGRN
jgi:hypothetical protein